MMILSGGSRHQKAATAITSTVIATGSIYAMWPVDPGLAAHKARCQRVVDDIGAEGLQSTNVMPNCLALRHG